jgi:hypothetical protein
MSLNLNDSEAVQRLFSQLTRDLLADLPPGERDRLQADLQRRAEELLNGSSTSESSTSFQDLIGLGAKGTLPFDQVTVPRIESDFDEAVVPTQLHAAASLYNIYQHERMNVFRAAGVLVRLFHEGRIRIQRGPGARALYLLERHQPLRYKTRERMLAYRRAFNYGNLEASTDTVVNRDFHRQFVAFNAAIAQYFRDLLIGEVIRGSNLINQRPFGSQATVQRIGADLRWMLDRATYGFIVPLTIETGNYLKTVMDVLDAPDIKKAFDANNKWDVLEAISQRHLGGIPQITQRTKMADAGSRLLSFIADDPFKTRDFSLFQTQIQPLGPVAEEWIAAYRMLPEGRNFRGVAPALQSMLGVQRSPSAA